ncbi:hypothetical protein [Actinomycetospora termitidis]|uniref:Uncharacterized protein n=1 Tax=Actinomycetospora termitidis TaxID=3053470 RepID=A0ABT7M5T7_9PSEU|nr:hypothetical protein [Actinomycetospora sp. Odt1-22]MDL5156040.1 hypothetical protein [Actinomycetospora sp. Odt1-22]
MAPERLLSDEPLDGVRTVRRMLFPPPVGLLLEPDDLTRARTTLLQSCDRWGGALSPLAPSPAGRVPSEPWASIFKQTFLERVAPRSYDAEEFLEQLGVRGSEGTHRDTVLNTLVRSSQGSSGSQVWAPVSTARSIPFDDPWAFSYYSTLGALPEEPGQESLRHGHLKDGIKYSDVLEFQDVNSENLTATDLLERLTDPQRTTCLDVSSYLLTRTPAARGSGKSRLPALFDPIKLRYGPNIIVVYTPGRIEDLCLIWNLRAAHGLPQGLPLAVPYESDTDEAISQLLDPYFHAFSVWGFQDLRIAVTSATLTVDELDAFTGDQGIPIDRVPFERLLQPINKPGIVSSAVENLLDGTCSLPIRSPVEARLLEADFFDTTFDLRLEAAPNGAKLPRSPTMQSTAGLGASFDRGCVVSVGRRTEFADFIFPTGFDVMNALAKDRGIRWRPSRPGRVAASLANRVGSQRDLAMLQSGAALDLIARLCARRGQTYIKRRLNDYLRPFGSEASLSGVKEELIAAIDASLGLPVEEERHEMTLGQVNNEFRDKRMATAWIEWLEQKQLVIRGFRLHCDRCGYSDWRSLGELSPNFLCRGCNQRIAKPFDATSLSFQYRASELLGQASSLDVLGHLLTWKYVDDVFAPRFTEKDGPIFGSFPGVEFLDNFGQVIGEADVVFVLEAGSFGIAECKNSASGMTEGELEKLWRLGELLDCSFTVASTLSPSRDCDLEQWQRENPSGRTHFALTREHLLDPHPIDTDSRSAFDWRATFVGGLNEEVDQSEHERNFKTLVRSMTSWERSPRKFKWDDWPVD